jgi:hypothetical protein
MKAERKGLPRHPDVWRLSEVSTWSGSTLSTGYQVLDQKLPGGGWPLGAITEILHVREGIGELRLVMPAIVDLARQGRRLVWVAPPHIPYAPALVRHGLDLSRLLLVETNDVAQSAWAAEQALRARGTGAVLLWSAAIDDRGLRRLQLAAELEGGWGVVFGPVRRANRRSTARLRLQLESSGEDLAVRVLKSRGTIGERVILAETAIAGQMR